MGAAPSRSESLVDNLPTRRGALGILTASVLLAARRHLMLGVKVDVYGSRHRAAALAFATAVTIGACTSGGTAVTNTSQVGGGSSTSTIASTATTSPVPSTSASTSVGGDSVVPSSARAHTAAGAEAFTSYFMNRANVAYRTAKPKELDDLISPSCKTCSAMREEVVSLHANRQYYDGDFGTATSITISTIDGANAKTFVSTRTAPCSVRDATNKVVKIVPADNSSLSFFLTFNVSWRVAEIKLAS